MRRPIPALDLDAAKNAWKASSQATEAEAERHLTCTLVTPLYGGGVEAGVVDEALPIRVAALRGQWRFWWRIAAGPFASPEEMFRRETAIWGGIAAAGPTASRVAVRLLDRTAADRQPAHHYVPNRNKPGELKAFPEVAAWADGYALFSAQGKLAPNRRSVDPEDPPKALAKPGLGFALGLRFAADLDETHRQEVLAALRWWASFGGIGARTRRGLGAVRVDGLEPIAKTEVEAAGGRLALLSAEDDPLQAWKTAVGLLKTFRQGLDVGRNKPKAGSSSPAGRSLWPEADTLRALSGHAHSDHASRIVPVDGFPRAAFGLPIVFHFKDAPGKAGRGSKKYDPDDHVLEPADKSSDTPRDRMASPLILRPYYDGTRWRPAALLLPGWRDVLNLPLKFKDKTSYSPTPWPADPARRKALAAKIPPMNGRGDDALSAFMDFFAKGGK